MRARAVDLALQARRRRADPDRRDAQAISAPRSICARSRAARTARRRRSISPPSAATAISCAARSPPGGSPPATIVSDGGLLVALAEMAMAGGSGVALDHRRRPALPPHAFCFGEDQARYLVETARARRRAGRGAARPGCRRGGSAQTGGRCVDTVRAPVPYRSRSLRRTNEAWLPGYMAQA